MVTSKNSDEFLEISGKTLLLSFCADRKKAGKERAAAWIKLRRRAGKSCKGLTRKKALLEA